MSCKMAVLYLEMVGLSQIMTVNFYGLNVAMTSNVEERSMSATVGVCLLQYGYVHDSGVMSVTVGVCLIQWGYVCDGGGIP